MEKLTWKGLTYSVRSFTLEVLFTLWEKVAESTNDGRTIRGVFEAGCEVLLVGDTKQAEAFRISGELIKDVLTVEKEDEIVAAYAFKERVDFFTNGYSRRGEGLKKSAPDLSDKITQKQQKLLRPKPQKGTKDEPGLSG